MVRRKEYDRLDVLEKAVGLFWQKGFKASSMSDIVQVTGLNTASMYKEFGDKDGLFEETLEYYRQHIASSRYQILIDEPNINGVEGFLQTVINGAANKGYKGCLIMNHLVQKNSISDVAAEKIDAYCSMVEDLLQTALRIAQANGNISKDKDVATLASFIICCVHGLVLHGCRESKKSDIPKLYDVIRQALV